MTKVRGLSLPKAPNRRGRDVRHVDGCPTKNTDVLSRNHVCKARETADYARERGLIGAVALVHTPTSGASPTGIPWLNQNHGDTGKPCLVVDELAQLIERPTVQRGSLSLPSRYPGADVGKVLKGYPASSVLSVFHDAPANHVVHIGCEPGFLFGSFSQKPLGSFGAFALKLLAKPAVAVPDAVHMRGRVDMAAGIHGDVSYTHVNTNHICHIQRFGFLDLTSSEQVEHPINQGQVSLTVPEAQKVVLPRPADKRHDLSTTDAPYRHLLLSEVPIQDSIVICNGPVSAERPAASRIELISICHLADAAHDHLCRQWECLPNLGIGQSVQLKLAKRSRLPGNSADRITGIVGSLQCLAKKLRLFWCREKFHFGSQFHAHIIPQFQSFEKGGARG